MSSVRTRLIAVFLAATLTPLAVTLWIAVALLEQSFSLSSTRELRVLSEALENTGRALFASTRDALRAEAGSGIRTAQIYSSGNRGSWPEEIRSFADSEETERFAIAGPTREQMQYLLRRGSDVQVYSRPIGVSMRDLTDRHAEARAVIERQSQRDFRRGFFYTFGLLVAAVWCVSLLGLILLASRLTKPVRELTAGLSELAAGNFHARLVPHGRDEVAAAMQAFNNTAEQLQASRDRLVAVTRLASWQTLARKMAHEVKNSLTPIRLTMEEIIARREGSNERFMEQAAQIVVDEVGTLERRVRAFSEFASEPPVHLEAVDVGARLQERVALLKTAHPEASYELQLEPGTVAVADEDLVKGILTNVLENAAQAAGAGGLVLGRTFKRGGEVFIEVHDSGPGVSAQAQLTLFEPTISFKKAGMGLGLSIARKSALLLGGDITLSEGELGGAGFRVTLPAYTDSWQSESLSLTTRRTSAVHSA